MADPPASFRLLLPRELREWVRSKAYEQDIPMAEVVRQAVQEKREREEAKP